MALIDIGGGTTDLILYVDGAVVHTAVIPIGGINLTNDIAQGLRTPMAEAERIKIKYGCASTGMIDPEETIEVPSVGGRQPRVIERRVLGDIIEPRVEEIFAACRHVIAETGYLEMLGSGAVITGGTTLLDGMPELGESCLGLPIRRGEPMGIGGLIDVVRSPAYATAVGLAKYGAGRLHEGYSMEEPLDHQAPAGLGRISQWLRDVF